MEDLNVVLLKNSDAADTFFPPIELEQLVEKEENGIENDLLNDADKTGIEKRIVPIFESAKDITFSLDKQWQESILLIHFLQEQMTRTA